MSWISKCLKIIKGGGLRSEKVGGENEQGMEESDDKEGENLVCKEAEK